MKKILLFTIGVCILLFFWAFSPKEIATTQARSGDNSLIENLENSLFWGDTHLHTSNSPDAFGYGNRLGFEEAYRFAKGEIVEVNGMKAQLKTPLDFLVIADHAEGFGVVNELQKGNAELMKDSLLRRWNVLLNGTLEESSLAAKEMPDALDKGILPKSLTDPNIIGPIMKSIWGNYLQTADRHNTPGKFTALTGFEWSSMPGGNNLHRVVVFRDNIDKTSQTLPFSSLQSNDPEDLWRYLKKYEEKTGGKVLAIPHNANMSNGKMFAFTNSKNEPISTDYANRRANWEPLTEVTQTKGQSESHPTLSPNDEFANQNIFTWSDANMTFSEIKKPSMLEFEFARAALKNGLLLKEKLGTNPFKFGMIGSTDSHTSLSSADDNNFYGKFSTQLGEKNRMNKNYNHGMPNQLKRMGWEYVAAGYAAVWAKSNSRTDIWDAMKRKEVYGTTGSRMQVRFFGGWNYAKNDIQKANYVKLGYEKGVPMGGDILPNATKKAPSFMIKATKDPNGANLDRVQVIKGWAKNGKTFEKIYEVTWSGKRKLDSNGKLPSVGNTINTKTGEYTNNIGSIELATVWADPDFDANTEAFYYVRVLEIPTPHWSVYDAVRYGIEHPKEAPIVNIEKAYTSPIWYSPTK